MEELWDESLFNDEVRNKGGGGGGKGSHGRKTKRKASEGAPPPPPPQVGYGLSLGDFMLCM